MYHGSWACLNCIAKKEKEAKEASSGGGSSRGGSSGGGGMGLGAMIVKKSFEGYSNMLAEGKERMEEEKAEARQVLDAEIPQDETEFLSMFTGLVSQLETLRSNTNKAKACDAKLSQMLRMLQLQNSEKYNQLLPMYQKAKKKSQMKLIIPICIYFGILVVFGVVAAIVHALG